jgi:hypothetical protein
LGEFGIVRHRVDASSHNLICRRCASRLKIIALIDSASIIERMLRHLNLWARRQRPPPDPPERSLAYDLEFVPSDDVDQRLATGE